jgi:cytochrome c553
LRLLRILQRSWRPLVLGLAAAVFCVGVSGVSWAQSTPERVQLCGACHGEDGNSRMPNIPSLAGQPEFFLVQQLILFREGVRKVPGMSELLKGLKDDDLVELAKHFAALEAKPSEEKADPALVKRGEMLAEPMRCASCHLPSLAGQQQMPRLARQRIDYLIHSLKQFRDDARSGADTLMSAVVGGVSDDDLVALAHYAASR